MHQQLPDLPTYCGANGRRQISKLNSDITQILYIDTLHVTSTPMVLHSFLFHISEEKCRDTLSFLPVVEN